MSDLLREPDPRQTFNAYLDTQKVYDVRLRKLLFDVMRQVDEDLKDITGTSISAKIGEDQALALKQSIHRRLSLLFSREGDLIQAGKEDAAAAAVRAFTNYEAMLLQNVMTKSALAEYIASAQATARIGVDAAMQRVMGNSYRRLAESVYGTHNLAKGYVDRLVETAIARGWSARDLAARVKSMINPNVAGGVSYAAQRLARTEINNAFHSVSTAKYQDSPYVTGVTWHLSGSHPEGDECDVLAAGGPYPKDKVPDKPHPLCFCYITPEVMSEDEFLDFFFSSQGTRVQ
uniref:Capsid maturation protease n=1 Tax=Micrococcus phage Kurnik TaxID=3092208 RepID=A0AAU6R674_9CAUD